MSIGIKENNVKLLNQEKFIFGATVGN